MARKACTFFSEHAGYALSTMGSKGRACGRKNEAYSSRPKDLLRSRSVSSVVVSFFKR